VAWSDQGKEAPVAELPPYLYTRQLPREQGVRPRGLGAPRPLLGDLDATARGQAVLARGIEDVAQTTLDVTTRLQRASDAAKATDAEAQVMESVLARQQELYRDQSIDPLQYRTMLEQHRDETITRLAETLPGRLQAPFRAQARARALEPIARADIEGTKRFGEAAVERFGVYGQQLERQALSSPSPSVQAEAQTAYDTKVDEYVGLGLFRQAQGDLLKQGFRDRIGVAKAEAAMAQDPAAAYVQFGKGPEENPTIPPAELPKLRAKAMETLRQQVTFQESRAASAKRVLQEEQSVVASGFRAQITGKADVTIPELVALLPQVNEARRQQRISEGDHAALLQDIQTLRNRLTDDAYKDRTVPAIAQQATLMIDSAETPGMLDTAREYVVTQAQNLSVERYQSLMDAIQRRRDKQDPLNDDIAKEARRVFLSGAFPGGIVPAVLDKINDGVKARTSAGLDQLNEELRRIYEQDGASAMRQQAIDLGRKFRELYFPESAQQQDRLPAGIPKAFEGLRTFEEAMIVLETIDLPQSAKRRIYLQLKQALPRAKEAPGAPAPTLPNPGRARTPGTPN
jgi:hypothetical protein